MVEKQKSYVQIRVATFFFYLLETSSPDRNWNVCRNVSGLQSNLGCQCRWNMRMLLVLMVLVILGGGLAMKGGGVVGSGVARCDTYR